VEKTLFRQVRIVTPSGISAPQDMLIYQGKIAAIDTYIAPDSDTEVVEWPNAHVSAGWFDVGAFAADPGFEHRDDLRSVAKAAAAGGFTDVALLPNTYPAIHAKTEVEYIQRQTGRFGVHFWALGAISNGCEGKDLAELHDMHQSGALAFTDGLKPVQDAGLLLRALTYSTAFGGLIINQPYHKSIAGGGQMHEGVVSTSLGLKGIPDLAEHLMVQRDLSLLEYAGPNARLHIQAISSASSVALIRQAKANGLAVTASVAVANLCFTDEQLALTPFNAQYKVMPPLRSADDRAALIEAVQKGTIDFICSNHCPWDEEAKNLEFPYAEFGMNTLQTTFSMLSTFAPQLTLPQVVAQLSSGPRRVLGQPVPQIEVGAVAQLTFFDPEGTFTPASVNWLSKSLNFPLMGQTLKGRVLRTICA
jgi:dihydroorotase